MFGLSTSDIIIVVLFIASVFSLFGYADNNGEQIGLTVPPNVLARDKVIM